jgi:hypothetical protein
MEKFCQRETASSSISDACFRNPSSVLKSIGVICYRGSAGIRHGDLSVQTSRSVVHSEELHVHVRSGNAPQKRKVNHHGQTSRRPHPISSRPLPIYVRCGQFHGGDDPAGVVRCSPNANDMQHCDWSCNFRKVGTI